MYWLASHARHCCRSSDPVFAAVRLLYPAGQLWSSKSRCATSRVQLPRILSPDEHWKRGGLFKAQERSEAHTPPLGHVLHWILPVEASSSVSSCGGHLHEVREVWPDLPLVVARWGQALQSLADLDPASSLYVSGGHA